MKAYIHGAVRITNQTVSHNGKEIAISNPNNDPWLVSIYRTLNLSAPKFFKMDNLCKAGFLAAEILMRENGLPQDEPKKEWSVILQNQASSLDNDRSYQQTIQDAENYFPSPAVFVYTLANIVTGEIAIRHKIMGESAFYVRDHFSADSLYDTALLGFSPEKKIQQMLCGWVDYDNGKCDVLLFSLSTQQRENDEEWNKENILKHYV